MLLEVAAGDRPTPGYTHHDARPLPDIEIVCDVAELAQFVKPRSCTQVRATHILEHFPHTAGLHHLRDWREFLIPGGRLYLEVPNGEWQYNAAHLEVDFDKWLALVFGDQDYPGNAHHTAFSPVSLHRVLMQAGFVNINAQAAGWVIAAEAVRA